MALNNPYANYKQNAVMTAAPEELTLMLFDGAIKFINQAKIYIEEHKFDKANSASVRAQDIITELNITLDMKYDISKNLRSLYEYMLKRLVDANIQKDTRIFDEVLDLVTQLRDTWKEAMQIAKRSR